MKSLPLLLIFGFIALAFADQALHLTLIPLHIYVSTSALLEVINNDKLIFFEYEPQILSVDKIKENCVKSKGEDAWREFEKTFIRATICLINPFNVWSFCPDYKSTLHKCINMYSEKLSICDEEDKKDLFSLHMNSTTKMADYICEAHPYLQNPNALKKMNATCLLQFANYMVRRDVKDTLGAMKKCMREKQASNTEKDETKNYCKTQLFLRECVLEKVNVYCGATSPVQKIVDDIFYNATFSLCNKRYNFTLS